MDSKKYSTQKRVAVKKEQEKQRTRKLENNRERID